MNWSVEQQRKFMKAVDKSHKEERERAKKLRSDAVLDGCIRESQYFLIEDALGAAYRAGAADAIFGEL